MNYYEHHIGDYAAATAHLSWDEDMAYTRLMRAYYHTERGIHDGEQYRIARAAGKAQRAAVDTVLAEFFKMRDGLWIQKRVEEEIARYRDKQDKARRSAEARWKPTTQHSERNANAFPADDANALRTHCEGNAPRHQTPDTIPKDQKQGRASAPELPEWLPESVWADWHGFRNARKGWTTKARELSLRTLTELREQGHDPRKVVEQSIERGWTGLFPIKPPDAAPRGSPPIAQDFASKTYTGTPEDELPDYLRSPA